ncbi:MAG: PD40 domain-containing protein [Bacteroidales bacterium]|nr:PD40 domain-containing protein [Bacteroidales bacterium]
MHRNRYPFLIVLVLTFFITRTSQSQDVREWFVEAESYFLFEEYQEALPLYHRILRAEPENYNVQSRIGVCYLNDIYQYPKAIKYLKTAAQHINFKYKQDSYKEKLAPPETQYYLGRAYHVNNMFNEAIESYQRFLNLASPDEFDHDVVRADIEACQRAKKTVNEKIYFSPKNLGAKINSQREDFNPVISGDGKVMIFNRKLPFYTGVFISYKGTNNQWSEPVDLTPEFAVDDDSYATGLSYHGDELFVYRSDNYDGNIYTSKRLNNKWAPLEKLNDNINTKYWESHASLSPDGQSLIFTSNRAGGYGGLDIYKSKRNSNGEWGEPVNLGPVVNSPSNEDTPFLSNGGNTLFFSSEGHSTIGGYDVFVSTLNSNGTWTPPQNMGYPVNTTNDNLFFCPIGVDAFGLYTFYNEESGNGMLDIYEVEVYNKKIPRTFNITGTIQANELESAAATDLKAKLITKNGRQLVDEQKINRSGAFDLSAPQGDYIFVIEGDGVETYQKEISFKIDQKENQLALNDIRMKETSKPYVPVQVAESKPLPAIGVKQSFYEVNDSDAVPIELTLPQGSHLNISVQVDNVPASQENLSDVNSRFTYFYGPQPGKNAIRFTATDPEGNISETEVVINYEAPLLAGSEKTESLDASLQSRLGNNYLQEIASESLKEYLNRMDNTSLKDYYSLYELLIKAAAVESFTAEEVQAMFAILFTQRRMQDFSADFTAISEVPGEIQAALLDSADIPYEYLILLDQSAYFHENEIRNTLMSMVLNTLHNENKLLFQISTFTAGRDPLSMPQDQNLTHPQTWDKLKQNYGAEEARDMLYLASTTEELNSFFQNLLVNSEGGLHDKLVVLNMELNNLFNAIDLVEYLFSGISESSYSAKELMDALQNTQEKRIFNLRKFQELLASQAEGTLKLQITEALNDIRDNSSYEDLLNYLINQSRQKDYSRESVYDLLVRLTGITDVGEFADKLISYNMPEINKALADTSIRAFSDPLELVQYLIASTQNYNFSDSDINNLLLRMVLEKGLKMDMGSFFEDADKGGKASFWKSKRFISTLILVNIALIILIILYTIRRRKKK